MSGFPNFCPEKLMLPLQIHTRATELSGFALDLADQPDRLSVESRARELMQVAFPETHVELSRTPCARESRATVLEFDLQRGTYRFGMLRFNLVEQDRWDQDRASLAQAYAEQTCLAMERAELRYQAQMLHAALLSNRLIGAATGVLMAVKKTSIDAAFAELTKVSQDSNRKLREVAEEVLLTGQLPVFIPARKLPQTEA
ncbi:ANTAR domain-containing protein [Nakamurella antarctica]|nr:ANTAR domain-containing protein [Nakamurella antarctica]